MKTNRSDKIQLNIISQAADQKKAGDGHMNHVFVVSD
jgi:hypothetical protein